MSEEDHVSLQSFPVPFCIINKVVLTLGWLYSDWIYFSNTVGAFIQFPLVVLRVHYPPPQVAALEEPPGEEGGHGKGWRPEWRQMAQHGRWFPWQDVRWSGPVGLIENRWQRLRHTRKLARKDQSGTVEQLGWRDARILLRGGPEAQEHPWEVRQPVVAGGAGPEGVLERMVTTLHLSLRVVGGGEVVKGAQALRKLSPEYWAELRAAVWGYVVGDTKAGHPSANEGVGASALQWESLQPEWRVVHHPKEVVEALLWPW